ncbi:MAG: formylglycine-generating enzyme family protein [Deltaproteobacteria bacterium]|nr:formylglycine-generating enzyme family protein [Deltaproteobacteria bacterium]
MVPVPGGAVLIGSNTSVCPDDEPLHEVHVDSFEIDRTEVTNAQYRDCVDHGECSPPDSPRSLTRPDYYSDPAFANFPVINVDGDLAERYCEAVGKRLPTEAEWEKAARGGCEIGGDPSTCEPAVDARSRPWGDESPACSRANAFRACVGDTSEVGSFPSDVSPYGAVDMGGNVAEIVNDYFRPDYYSSGENWNPQGPSRESADGCCGASWSGSCRVRKGDNFDGREADPTAVDRLVSCRDPVRPGEILFGLGFRCAR